MTDDAMRNTTLRPVTEQRADELLDEFEAYIEEHLADDRDKAREAIRAILIGAFERVEAKDAPP
jgi:DNA-binding GntR family transcriptional regulator